MTKPFHTLVLLFRGVRWLIEEERFEEASKADARARLAAENQGERVSGRRSQGTRR